MMLILIWSPSPTVDPDSDPNPDWRSWSLYWSPLDSYTVLFCSSDLDPYLHLDPDSYPDLRSEFWSLSWSCSEVLIQIQILILLLGPDLDPDHDMTTWSWSWSLSYSEVLILIPILMPDPPVYKNDQLNHYLPLPADNILSSWWRSKFNP